MQIRGRVFRLSILFGILAGVVVFPASPGLAGSSHTTFSFAALPAALTLSDNSPHLGLVKAAFATQNTTATHTVLTVSTTQPTGPSTSVPFPVTVTSIVQQPVPKACAGTVSGSLVTTPVTCNLGNVNPNTTLPPLLIEFQSPAGCAMGVPPCVLTATGSVTFAEGNTNQGTDSSIVPRNIQLFSTAQKAS